MAVAIASGLDRTQAEDAVHDALIKTAMSATGLADDELPIYAAKAVRNLAVNMHRDTAMRVGIVKNASLRPEQERFEERVLAKIIASDLLAHMSQTEPAETVEMLVWWTLGYTHAEICEVYGKTEPAVQSRLHRATEKQRGAMAK